MYSLEPLYLSPEMGRMMAEMITWDTLLVAVFMNHLERWMLLHLSIIWLER